MNRVLAMTSINVDYIYSIFKKIKTIPMNDLMFFIPHTISQGDSSHGDSSHGDSSTCIMNYKEEYESFLSFLNKKEMIMRERELLFYKKHLQLCLEQLHSQDIFFYFHIDNLYIHGKSKMPLLNKFDNSCILDTDSMKNHQHIKRLFSKPIKNKYVPFSMFFFHFVAFSLCSENKGDSKAVSIYELYDNNVSIFYEWNREELKEVENIVKEGKDYEGIFNYYIEHKELWFQWDFILLEKGFMKIM
jgi:hypothetical protein